jgi:hypothetical protein
MRRREFIGLVGIGVAAPHFWPFSADAQQGERISNPMSAIGT